MSIEWRTTNDWIHCDEHGNLLTPLVAIEYCAKRNIRLKTECTAFAVKNHYEKEIVPKLKQMNTVQPDAKLLREV